MSVTQTQPTPALDELDQLIGALNMLRRLSPLERAKVAASMDRQARAALGRVADEATFYAAHELVGTRQRTQPEVAQHLGVTPSRVGNRVQEYRRWVAERGQG